MRIRSSLPSLAAFVLLAMLLPQGMAVAQARLPQPGDSDYVPLTGKQRSDRFFKGYQLSPGTYFAAAGAASGAQIANDPKEWQGRWSGYGKRTTSTFALFTVQAAVHEGGDAVLGYDPRYFRCRCSIRVAIVPLCRACKWGTSRWGSYSASTWFANTAPN